MRDYESPASSGAGLLQHQPILLTKTMMRRQKTLLTMKILMKNMMNLKLKQLQRNTMCSPKKITSHQKQCILWSIVQYQCLMMRIMMRMKERPMISISMLIVLCKIAPQMYQLSNQLRHLQMLILPHKRLARYHTQRNVWTLNMKFCRKK